MFACLHCTRTRSPPKRRRLRELDHSEALGALANRNQQRLLELLVALVVGQAQLIEARVRRRQIAERWRRRDLEPRTQLLKAAGRQLRTAGGELQQARHFRLAEIADGRPKPAQHAAEFLRIAIDHVMRPEIGDRVLAGTAKQQLQQQHGKK